MAYTRGHNNYGTSLQGYALLKVLQRLGHDVEIINYEKRSCVKEKVVWVINAIRIGEWHEVASRLKGNHILYKLHQDFAQNISKRTEAVDAYKAKKLLPQFQRYVGYAALHEGSKRYDAVVVGSDQVWTPMGLPTRFYNLLFVDDRVRKVAYASSFGVSDIPDFQKEQTGMYLDRFHAIGVREQRGKEIVEALSHQQVQVVADPTLLLLGDQWKQELNEDISASTEKNRKRAEQGGYIFCYFLGSNQEARKAARDLQQLTGLRILNIRHMDEYVATDEQFGDEAPYDVDPNDFVRYVAHADYVCTDSFHCTVFSIIFHRRFMTFYRFAQTSKTGRNSRIDSLFQIADIPHCHLFSGDIKNINETIDWEKTDLRIASLRDKSIKFLQEALT